MARQGEIGLCLSGGGYRAALFHLGALRRLNEIGLLSRIDTVSSVSGGSIVAAHLAQTKVAGDVTWPEKGGRIPNFEDKVIDPLDALTGSKNIRSKPILERLKFWKLNPFKTGVEGKALAGEYEEIFGIKLKLGELPMKPNFVLLATDMVFGQGFSFERSGVGHDLMGYTEGDRVRDWKLAYAVAASSCFPPFFRPMPLPIALKVSDYTDRKQYNVQQQYTDRKEEKSPLAPEDIRTALVGTVTLTDGGVYDNMGLDNVWNSHTQVLVSDGGAPFKYGSSTEVFDLSRIYRYTEIQGAQAYLVRKRWLISKFQQTSKAGGIDGGYWGITSCVEDYQKSAKYGYDRTIVDHYISRIRTDMDKFSAGERAVLQNHGYTLVQATLEAHAPHLLTNAPAFNLPFKEYAPENAAKVKEALKNSDNRKYIQF